MRSLIGSEISTGMVARLMGQVSDTNVGRIIPDGTGSCQPEFVGELLSFAAAEWPFTSCS